MDIFYKKVLVITDNKYLFEKFYLIIKKHLNAVKFTFAHSKSSESLFADIDNIKSISVKKEVQSILNTYDIVISIHCKQLFPPELVNNIKCINIHPGLNPYNRGWYPQVFAILNKLPHGATIHEIDEKLDHGAIIDQKEIVINSWDTSLSVYDRVLEAELRLLDENLVNILSNRYSVQEPLDEGNINYIKDFNKLKEIDLNQKGTFKDFIDKLRSLSHGEFKNAYFIDGFGHKIYVKIDLEKDSY